MGELDAFVDVLPPDFTLICGGAEGADQHAIERARARGLTVEDDFVSEEEWNQIGQGATFVRNERLVKLSVRVVAFWLPPSGGTAHAIRVALSEGKLQKIVTPWGTLRLGDPPQTPGGNATSSAPMAAGPAPPVPPGEPISDHQLLDVARELRQASEGLTQWDEQDNEAATSIPFKLHARWVALMIQFDKRLRALEGKEPLDYGSEG